MRARALLALAAAMAVAASGCFGPDTNEPPHVFALVSLAQAAVGQEVIFTGSGADVDGSIVLFEWDFDGDGTVDFSNASRGAATHVYSAPGLYRAEFVATDNEGAQGNATVNVTIVASFAVTTDWGSHHAYLISKAAALNASAVRVTALPAGAAGPTNFTAGAGLQVLNDTALRIALPLATLTLYGSTRVQVYYNGTLGADRVVRAVPFLGAENDTKTRSTLSSRETRPLPDSSLTLTYAGTLDMAVAGAIVTAAFTGNGTSDGWSLDGTTNTSASYAFSRVAWNQTFGRYLPGYNTLDYSWQATGRLEAVSASGFVSVVNLTTYEGARQGGNLSFQRAAGAGYYVGDLANSFGSTAYVLNSSARSTVNNGNGIPTDVLRISENLTMNGTLGGSSFQQTNLSERLVAASDMFYHPDVSTAWNTTGRLGSLNISDAGARFLDSDGNGAFNPDARPRFVSDGQNYAGLAPAELQEGDAFEVKNSGAGFARLVVGPASTEVLVADGFTPVAIQVVTVTGRVASVFDPGELPGTLTYRMVASGFHAGLRLSSSERISYHGQSFERDITLTGKAP